MNEMPATDASLQVTYDELPVPSVLAALWQELETRAPASFFTSWRWIENWLACVPSSVTLRLLTVREQDRVVALGIFAHTELRRHGIVRAHAALLHETGLAQFDDLTIEYNGLLAEHGRAPAALAAACAFLAANSAVEEIYLGGVDRAYATPSTPVGMQLTAKGASRSYYIALDEIRAAGMQYLPYLSAKNKKFRYQIKQRMTQIGKLGAFAVHAAETALQARDYLLALKQLHQAHWTARGLPGAFANEQFERFHLRLVERAFDRGEIQLLKISAGDSVIGYFYNFVYRGHLYHYQSGFNYDGIDPKASPGLVAHCLAIEYCLAQGIRIYDFMGGDSQYKRTLATRETEMLWWVLQRNSLKFRIERWARALKRRLKPNA